MNGRDKRRAPRNRHNSVIEIFDVEGKVAASARLIDFSEVGASFAVGEPVVMPEKFRARLRILDKGVMEAGCRLVWTRRDRNITRYGIEFDSLRTESPANGKNGVGK